MRHWAVLDDVIVIGGGPTTTTLTPGNGIGVSGNRVTITPTFTPATDSVTASYLTFSNNNGDTVNINADIFNT